MSDAPDLQSWLRKQCADFVFRPEGVYVANGEHDWPLVAGSPAELTEQLEAGGHLVSLPKESAALANVIEVALVDFLLERLERFAELRAGGMLPIDAGRELGIGNATALGYECWYRRERLHLPDRPRGGGMAGRGYA